MDSDSQPEDLRQALAAAQERYRALADLSQAVNSSLDIHRVFWRAAEQLRRLCGCDRVALSLRDGQGFAVEFGPSVRWVNSAVPPPSGEFRSVLEIPLASRGQPVGQITLAARAQDRAAGWDRPLLEELGRLLAVAVDNARAYRQIADLKKRVERDIDYLREESEADRGLVGDTPAMGQVQTAIQQVAGTDSTVLILGETGTGKELVARAIHAVGPRRKQLLVTVNCAALAPALITSELFGHEAGAFTGATRRRQGRFELAHRGTIFLDEIGELPADVQAMLLRALQERVIERVGGSQALPVDVRVIAATNRDLQAAVKDGRFRADLFYRLHVFPIHVPPLRDRREDIPVLSNHFLARFARRMNRPARTIGARTLRLLCDYSWPGNVRELENIIERGVIAARGDVLEIDPAWLPESSTRPESSRSLAAGERQAILDALARAAGRIYGPGGAASALGLKPGTLYGKMKKHGIRKRPNTSEFE